MKKLLLIALLVLSFASCANKPDTSIEAFKQASGYTGQVCIVTPDARCANHVPYNPATVNAYTGYQLWATCVKYPDAPVCEVN